MSWMWEAADPQLPELGWSSVVFLPMAVVGSYQGAQAHLAAPAGVELGSFLCEWAAGGGTETHSHTQWPSLKSSSVFFLLGRGSLRHAGTIQNFRFYSKLAL